MPEFSQVLAIHTKLDLFLLLVLLVLLRTSSVFSLCFSWIRYAKLYGEDPGKRAMKYLSDVKSFSSKTYVDLILCA